MKLSGDGVMLRYGFAFEPEFVCRRNVGLKRTPTHTNTAYTKTPKTTSTTITTAATAPLLNPLLPDEPADSLMLVAEVDNTGRTVALVGDAGRTVVLVAEVDNAGRTVVLMAEVDRTVVLVAEVDVA